MGGCREEWAAGGNSPKLKSLNLDRKGGMKEGREKRREGEREEGNKGKKTASTSVAFITVCILMFPLHLFGTLRF